MNEKQINNGGPAFPHDIPAGCRHDGTLKRSPKPGMSIRTTIAMHCIARITDDDAPASIKAAADMLGILPEDYKYAIHWPAIVAKMATAQADALIAELTKGGGTL